MRNRWNQVILAACVPAVFLLLSAGCGQRGRDFGVVVWSANEETLKTGTIVTIQEESQLNASYTIRIPGSRERIEVEKWRVLPFDSEEEAEKFRERTAAYRTLYGKSLRNALPLRSEPNQNGERVYKLGEGQIFKIVDRAAELSTEGPYTGYWYRVLTEDGVMGYCFDISIELVEGGIPAVEETQGNGDPALESLLSRSYVPESLLTMVRSGRVSLRRIDPAAGLFPDPAAKTVRIVTPHGSLTFPYTEIVSPRPRHYIFSGTSLSITLLSNGDVQADYAADGTAYSEIYGPLQTPVADVVAAEEKRQADMYGSLMSAGQRFNSTAYGRFSLPGQLSFSWEGYQRLVPALFPRDLGTTGTVSFPLFLGPELSGKYAGVLSLQFDRDRTRLYSFLYSTTDQGIRLQFVPESAIADDVVSSDTGSPFVIVFTAAR